MSLILDKYLAAHPAADAQLLTDFCKYAQTWFVASNIVGVGVNCGGVALTLGDGTTTNLFVVAQSPAPPQDVVHITGTSPQL